VWLAFESGQPANKQEHRERYLQLMNLTRLARVVLFLGLCCVCRSARAQEKVLGMSGCELAKNPKTFDGKLIRVRGTLSVHFEDFSLLTDKCETQQGIWLAFGGDVPGIVVSTANDNARKPGSTVKLDGVSYGIEKDENFHKLYALIAARHGEKPDYEVTATLRGKFFAGEESRTIRGAANFVGYGHLGCCSLLLITQVADVDSVPRANLTLHGVVTDVNGKPMGGLTVINDVVGGSPPERQKAVTNKHGEFTFFNSGQQLRIEDPRYRPLALTVEPGGMPVRVVLQEAKRSDWVISACGDSEPHGRIGFSALFVLPKDMESSPYKADDRESIFVYSHGEEAVTAELIISRNLDGSMEEANSLDSEQFGERWIKDSVGNVLGIDSRGLRRGEYWREAVFFGNEIAGYWLRAGRPEKFDGILDSGCITKSKP
jgi:hypothetical protein